MGEVLPASVPVTYRCVTSTLPITSDHQKLRILWVRNSDRAWGGQGGSGCPTVAQHGGCPAHRLSLSPGPGRTCLTGAAHTLMRWLRSAARLSSSKVTPTGSSARVEGGPWAQPATCSHAGYPAGKYFWRLNRDRHLVSLQPAQMHRFWRGLPLHLDGVDAVYERTIDHKIVFFKGGHPPGCSQDRGACGLLRAERRLACFLCTCRCMFAEHLLCGPHCEALRVPRGQNTRPPPSFCGGHAISSHK